MNSKKLVKEEIEEVIKNSVFNTVHDLIHYTVYNKIAIEIDTSSNWNIMLVNHSIKNSVWDKHNVIRSK